MNQASNAKFVMAALAAATAMCAAPFASAQSNSANSANSATTITVDLADVSATVAKNISVEATKIPTTLQVPVGIAAAACGIEANVLTPKGGAGAAASCKATTTSTALDQLVQKEMKTATKK